MSHEATDREVWVSCSSHRARGTLVRIVGKLPSFGVWPKKGGWPRGEYYKVPRDKAGALTGVKGLKVMQGAPQGDIFRRIEGL